jgi:hypothetical protein
MDGSKARKLKGKVNSFDWCRHLNRAVKEKEEGFVELEAYAWDSTRKK